MNEYTTHTRDELVNALRLCSRSSDAACITHAPTGTRFHFKELRGTTEAVERAPRTAKIIKRTLSVAEEVELRAQRTTRAIKTINKQPKTLWEPRKQRAAA